MGKDWLETIDDYLKTTRRDIHGTKGTVTHKQELEKAQEEINRLTDLTISYETITKGRKVVKIKFLIKQKGVAERMKVVWREN